MMRRRAVDEEEDDKKENAMSVEGSCLCQAGAADSLLTLACGVRASTRVRPGKRRGQSAHHC